MGGGSEVMRGEIDALAELALDLAMDRGTHGTDDLWDRAGAMAARLTRATFGENGSGRRTIYLKFVGLAEHLIVSEEEVRDED